MGARFRNLLNDARPVFLLAASQFFAKRGIATRCHRNFFHRPVFLASPAKPKTSPRSFGGAGASLVEIVR
jgi:hypothetical protein